MDIRICATFTTQLLEDYFKFWLHKFRANISDANLSGIDKFTFTDYNSVFFQLLNPSAEFSTPQQGLNVLLFRGSDFAEDGGREFSAALRRYLGRTRRKLILVETASENQSTDVIEHIVDVCKEFSHCVLCRKEEVEMTYPATKVHDKIMEKLGDIPYTQEYYCALATFIFRKLYVDINSASVKVFVSDCDNTLWKGILLEDGPKGVKPNLDVQDLLKKQTECGRVLALNSANDIEPVRDVFQSREDFILKSENVTSWKVNWNPKLQNIIDLADELTLGLDSFIFLDDDHVNVESVREALPEVLSFKFPESSPEDIKKLWVMDPLLFTTSEDKKRGEMYKQNNNRAELRKQNSTFREFLLKLEMKIDCVAVDESRAQRVAQMTQRTNRFNATSVRMTEDEVEKRLLSEEKKDFVFDISDKFGSYGIAGVLMCEVEGEVLRVENLLMSCRVLNRGVELEMLKLICSEKFAKEKKVLEVLFKQSGKNSPVEEFLNDVCELTDGTNNDGKYRISIDKLREVDVGKYFDFREARVNQNSKMSSDELKSDNDQNGGNKQLFIERNKLLNAIATGLADVKSISAGVKRFLSSETENKSLLKSENIDDIVFTSLSSLLNVSIEYLESEIHTPLMQLGLNSLKSVQFIGNLIQSLSSHQDLISTTLTFEYPTIAKILMYLNNTTAASSAEEEKVNEEEKTEIKEREVSVVSMACKFSGGISSPAEFFDFLCEKKSGKQNIEERRWETSSAYPEDCKSEVLFNHNLHNVDVFDHSLFGISEVEGRAMDPQQRLSLTVAYEALLRSGIRSPFNSSTTSPLSRFEGANTGVFVAVCNTDWAYIKAENPSVYSSYSFSGRILSINSGRISNIFGLTGPALNLDTACSSSLVAVDAAMNAMATGKCDSALVIGVNLNLHPETFIQLSRARQLSPTGECRTFDVSANGFARGEGCGAVVLKWSDALKENEVSLAKIKGVFLNNDGRAASLSAPNGTAQKNCIEEGLKHYGVEKESVAFVETHGSGTRLGDAIEFNSLKSVFSQGRNTDNKLVLGAVKSNIGHLESAAGMAGLIKAIMVLMTQSVPPNLYLKELSPDIRVGDFPVVFPDTVTPISKHFKGKRRALVSSFGMSGTNGMLIVEEDFNCRREELRNLDSLEKPSEKVNPKSLMWEKCATFKSRENIHTSANLIPKSCVVRTDDESLLEVIKSAIVKVSGVRDTGLIFKKSSFKELGVDSLASIEMANILRKHFEKNRVNLDSFPEPSSLIYEYPTVGELESKLVQIKEGKVEIEKSISRGVVDVIIESIQKVCGRSIENNSDIMKLKFKDIGVDSLAGIELANILKQKIDVVEFPESASLIYEYPTIGELTKRLETNRSSIEVFDKVKLAVEKVSTLNKELNGRESFVSLGLDSLAGIELSNVLLSMFKGLNIPEPASLIFKYPTVDELVQFISSSTGAEGEDRSSGVLDKVKEEIVKVSASIKEEDIELRSEFKLMGIDSLAGIELGNSLVKLFPSAKLPSPEQLIYSLNTVDDLVNVLESDNNSNSSEGENFCLLFTGQGSQYFKMGYQLYLNNSVFRTTIQQFNSIYKSINGECILDKIYGFGNTPVDEEDLNLTLYSQPSIVAFEIALYEAMRANDTFDSSITPKFVSGHSVGEITACYVAGILSLKDTVKVVSARAKAMASLPLNKGQMVSLRCPASVCQSAIDNLSNEDLKREVGVAAVNGPRSCVLSGSKEAVKAVLETLSSDIATKKLIVSHAFHCPLMTPAWDQFKRVLSEVDFKEPSSTLVSCVTGAPASLDEIKNPLHWKQHLLGTVDFLGAISHLLERENVEFFLEIGPRPILTKMGAQIALHLKQHDAASIKWINPKNRTRDDLELLQEAVEDLMIFLGREKRNVKISNGVVRNESQSTFFSDSTGTDFNLKDVDFPVKASVAGESKKKVKIVEKALETIHEDPEKLVNYEGNKLDSLVKSLFDESTLMERMENRLVDRLLEKWEGRGESNVLASPRPQSVSSRLPRQLLRGNSTVSDAGVSATVASTIYSRFSTHPLEVSKGHVFVVDGGHKVTKAETLAFVSSNMDKLYKEMRQRGAVLIRHAGLKTPQDFKDILDAFSKVGLQTRDYLDGISPRTQVLDGIYTSTEYPAEHDMALHNEMSYNPLPPTCISFFCERAPKKGEGRTPLASSSHIMRKLSPELVETFREKGVRYIVNSPSVGKGPGVPWQKMYCTEDRKVVDKICSDLGITTRWSKEGFLTTFRDAPAIRKNEYTGKELWFNHSHLFHPTDLPKAAQEALKAAYGDNHDKYPKFALFADGSSISDEWLSEIREAQRACSFSFDWEEGDLIIIDNFVLCHGRGKFDKNAVPKRRILASMLF